MYVYIYNTYIMSKIFWVSGGSQKAARMIFMKLASYTKLIMRKRSSNFFQVKVYED